MWHFRLWDVQDVAVFFSITLYMCHLGKQHMCKQSLRATGVILKCNYFQLLTAFTKYYVKCVTKQVTATERV